MRTAHRAGVIAIFMAAWPTAEVVGQRAGSASLAVNVVPESQLTPSRLSMRFTVSSDGRGDDLRQSSIVTARVRALPNHPIKVTARVAGVMGPSGATREAIIAWTGSSVSATGGAQGATCISGSFAAGPSQELVADWPSSGSITCRVEFTLTNPRALVPGLYTASVEFVTPE